MKYPSIGNVYASYQPMFLIDQMLSICDFEGLPPRMSIELVDRAWEASLGALRALAAGHTQETSA